ncbi:hypothetical protein SDC9_112211 [bioreactor metagenome]|uniref:Uncharacterized protein n=1 Tax=bioreactor metagenome TaxID=1076179 RepID=A0A645BJE1_9ZZZZ
MRVGNLRVHNDDFLVRVCQQHGAQAVNSAFQHVTAGLDFKRFTEDGNTVG